MKCWKLKIWFNIICEFLDLPFGYIFYYKNKTPKEFEDEFIDLFLVDIKFSRHANLIKNKEVILS